MTEMEPDPSTAPRVQDKNTKPAGTLPKNTQPLVLGGIALVMVGVMAFCGKSPPKDRGASNGPAMTPIVDPNAARIQEYQKGIEEVTRRLKAQQEQVIRAQQTLGVPPSSVAAIAGGAPYPGQTSYPRADELRYQHTELSPEENWIQTEKRKRDYQSLFASNVALSYRKELVQDQATAMALALGRMSPASPYALKSAQGLDGMALPSGSTQATAGAEAAGVNSPALRPADERGSEAGKGHAADRDAAINRADGKLYRLFEGNVIETVLTNRLDGEFSGPVNCMVTTNLFSLDGQRLLIPQGSRVLGEVRRVETFGQKRLAVVFHRLVMPDGYSVSLDKFQGLNQVGETGLRDQVNHHYAQIFGASIAIGAIAGLSQANTRYGADQSAADAYRQGVATSLSQSSLNILDRFLNVLPTFTIREGHRVKVYLSDDLLLPAYEKHQMPSDL